MTNAHCARWLLAGALLLGDAATGQRAFDTDILRETFGYDDGSRRTVDLSELQQGCPARDCIPSIDDPVFVPAGEASHVAADDPVIAVDLGGVQRAYPTAILDQHEIVNDRIGDTPLAITWCPLCGSAVGVDRRVAGAVTEFGVSGLLFNSDLVLYDRATGTLWDQIEATGIVGPLTGERLALVPVSLVRFGDWAEAHPGTEVLSTDTGFADRDYERDYYAKYRASDALMFPVSRTSDRLPPKARVYGFLLPQGALALAQAALDEANPLGVERFGREYSARRDVDGSVRLTDVSDGSSYAPIPLFWFAWYTFHPETELVR